MTTYPETEVEHGAETEAEHEAEHEIEHEASDLASVSLFEGDEGELEHAQRRTLVTLLKQRFISARTHPRDWRLVTEHERLFRSRLNDLFLELHLDREREVAWKRQAVPETGGRFPTLLHDTSWSREETVVLVHLRDRLRAAAAVGDARVYVDRQDVIDFVAGFRPPHATDVAGDEKRARNAVLSLQKAGLLIGGANDDRFEISEAVESLLPLDLLTELLEELRRHNGSGEERDRAEGDAPGDADDALFEGYEPPAPEDEAEDGAEDGPRHETEGEDRA